MDQDKRQATGSAVQPPKPHTKVKRPRRGEAELLATIGDLAKRVLKLNLQKVADALLAGDQAVPDPAAIRKRVAAKISHTLAATLGIKSDQPARRAAP